MAYKRKKGAGFTKGKKKDYSFNGIKYKSGLERNMGMLLHEAGIYFEYEPISYTLMDGFLFDKSSYERSSNGNGDMIDRGNKKILPIKYTPDFVGDGFIIETKGYANETFPRTWKMFKRYVIDNGMDVILYKPQKISECEEVIKLIKQNQ